MFYYINLLGRAPRSQSKPSTAVASEPKTFVTDLNFIESEPQFGGMDATPQMTPNLECFTDMSALDADSAPETNNDSCPGASGDMHGDLHGGSEGKANNRAMDIAEITLTKTLSIRELGQFVEVFQS